jgi:penicillin-binding protein 1C
MSRIKYFIILMKWLNKNKLIILPVIAVLFLFALGRLVPPYEFQYLKHKDGARILDRQGTVLRIIDRGGQWAGLKDISSWVKKAVICSEDRRFYWHPGVDPLSLCRAVWQNITHRRIVSGGSTITMQLARNIIGPRRRSLLSKAQEALLSFYLEWRLSKNEILETYLNLAPFANECYGVRAASLFYFQKVPADISLAQATFLSVIPRNPRAYNPYRAFAELSVLQQNLLKKLGGQKNITIAEYEAAAGETLVLEKRQRGEAAGHFCDWIQNAKGVSKSDIRTTLDSDLNQDIQKLVKTYVRKLYNQGITNAAVVVLRNSDRALLAMVGSADYQDAYLSGQVNGAVALRQPGSTLKPFTYGLAVERGFPPSYLLPDVDARSAGFRDKFTPRNYDERCHGPVRLRTALGCSYNIPAVRMLEEIGEQDLLEKLHQAGFANLKKDPEYYGLGLTLGNGEVTLLELASAYAALANGGVYRREKTAETEIQEDSAVIFSPQTSFIITQILSDRSARAPAFGECSPLDLPFACAAKTGTTKDYRDNWTVGYTAEYTVGVWVGNFDGRPMHGVSGVSGAGPLFRDIMLMLHRGQRPADFPVPAGLISAMICPLSGDLAGGKCPDAMNEYFLEQSRLVQKCRIHRPDREELVYGQEYREWAGEKYGRRGIAYSGSDRFRIIFPSEGEVFKLDPGLPRESQAVTLRAQLPEGATNIQWHQDGKALAKGENPRLILEPGRHRLSLSAQRGNKVIKTASVEYLVLL